MSKTLLVLPDYLARGHRKQSRLLGHSIGDSRRHKQDSLHKTDVISLCSRFTYEITYAT